MHEDRDNYIILITLLPVVICIGLYATWRSAGEPSISLSGIPFPAISLPVLPDLRPYIPAAIMSWLRNIQRNGDTIFPAVGLGLFMGLVGMGAFVDLMKKLWKLVTPEPLDVAGPPTAESPITDAPAVLEYSARSALRGEEAAHHVSVTLDNPRG
jgi:hypothetical protein